MWATSEEFGACLYSECHMYVRKCRKVTLFLQGKNRLDCTKRTMYEQLDFWYQIIPINSISANDVRVVKLQKFFKQNEITTYVHFLTSKLKRTRNAIDPPLEFHNFVLHSRIIVIVIAHHIWHWCWVIRSSGRPKQVNTEITETKISVWFTELKPIIPNRISQYIIFSSILVLPQKMFEKLWKMS